MRKLRPFLFALLSVGLVAITASLMSAILSDKAVQLNTTAQEKTAQFENAIFTYRSSGWGMFTLVKGQKVAINLNSVQSVVPHPQGAFIYINPTVGYIVQEPLRKIWKMIQNNK